METRQRYAAELLGSLVLVFVAGAAIVTSGNALVVAGAVGAAFAGMWFVFAPRTGGHFNPALTLASAAVRRTSTKDLVPILVSQVLGALLGAALLYAVLDGRAFATAESGIASAGPLLAGWSLLAVAVMELVLTAAFVLVYLRLTERGTHDAATGVALGGIYAGLCLGSLAVTWSALNPLRTIGPMALGGVTQSLWVFWAAPLLGAALAAGVWVTVLEPERATAPAPAFTEV